jgi:glycosyltransferase involved in cell wall biosynthesis
VSTDSPLVSIVIPVYNGGDFLDQAIDSALAQTYRNIEILVINDGSDDSGETDRVALSYGDMIRYYKKSNGGVASALNRAIAEMSGEYFSWLSHDDLYVKEKVARQVEALSLITPTDRKRTIFYSDHEVFTSDPGNTVPVLLSGVPPEEFRYWLTTENMLHGCTLLIPKEAFVEMGRFNESLRTTQDYDLWFRMARNFRFVHLPARLVKARSHPEQGSVIMSGLAVAECNTLLSGFIADLSEDELMRSTRRAPVVAYAQIAASMWYRGFMSAAWLAMRFSLKNFSHSSLRLNALALAIISKVVVMYSIVEPLRRITPPSVRLTIKRALRVTGLGESRDPQSLRNLELKEKFTEVYEKNIFRGSVSRSGEGSDLVQTAIIRREIPALVEELGIKTFLDAPCGDWYWMKEVDLPVERYIGLDIVEALVEKNQKIFGSEKVSFQCINLAEGELPKADLVFSRDCLVHLSFADSLKIIANFKRSGAKYLLTTTFTSRTKNEDLGDGFWRPLNKQLAPFNFPEPIRLINEGCTEGNNLFKDKCLGLWRLQDINLPESV